MSIMDRFTAEHDENVEPLEDTTDEHAHVITLRKFSKRAVAPQTLDAQIELLRGRVMTTGRVRQGWALNVSAITTDVVDSEKQLVWKYRAPAGNKVYSIDFTFSNHSKASPAEQAARFKNIVNTLVAASNQRATGQWQVDVVDGNRWEDVEAAAIKSSGESDFVGYASMEIPQNWQDHFSHIYNRDSQISLMMSCLFAAADSDFDKRFNALFAGPPANGKTEVGLALGRMLGDAFLRFDGTAMTQAGITKELAEREELPRIIFVEEIEKAEEPALRVLLGIMDTRGEIRKITAREKIEREARCIVIATCNDYTKLEGMLAGALASRFGEPIWFPSVDRSLMEKILMREVSEIAGGDKWVAATLDYCDRREIRDPRKAISFCLRGREGWLNGSFERDLENVRKIGAKVMES